MTPVPESALQRPLTERGWIVGEAPKITISVRFDQTKYKYIKKNKEQLFATSYILFVCYHLKNSTGRLNTE